MLLRSLAAKPASDTLTHLIFSFVPQVCIEIWHTDVIVHNLSVSTVQLVIVSICSFDNLVFFQNEEIFVQLDKLDELDRIPQAWIGFSYSLTQAQKTF